MRFIIAAVAIGLFVFLLNCMMPPQRDEVRYVESCTDSAVMETLVQPNGCVVYMRLFNRHLRVQTTAVNCLVSIGDTSDVTATLVP